VTAIAAISTGGWAPVAIRRDQLKDHDVGPILEEVKAGQCPKLNDIVDWSPTYKGYCAQWKSLAVKDGIQEHH
jgi:hypothetical protein